MNVLKPNISDGGGGDPILEAMGAGNDSEHDPSCELLCDFCHYGTHTIYVMGLLASIVVGFGIVANALNARIFTHRFMRVSLLNWYYAALSISDLFVLITGFLRDCLPRIADYSAAYGLYSAASMLAPATQAIGCVAQTASVSACAFDYALGPRRNRQRDLSLSDLWEAPIIVILLLPILK